MHIRQSPLQAVVEVREAFVVEAQEVQDGCVEIVNGRGMFGRFVAHFVGRAPGESRFHSGTSEPTGEDMLVRVST